MIKVKRAAEPSVLSDPEGKAAKERKAALEHYKGSWEASFKFSVYRDTEVKFVLNQTFHYKCAYCESRYLGTAPVDVEHYRPKLAVVTEKNKTIKPGYYWLASEWTNLLPSCIDCNRKRTHDLNQEDVEPLVSGKANLFPVKDDKRKTLKPDADRRETRLLFHPCEDDVETSLKFKAGDGGVRVLPSKRSGINKLRAEKSIEVLGLNRPELLLTRQEVYVRFKKQLSHVSRSLKRFKADSDNTTTRDELAIDLSDFMRFLEETKEYACMCRYFFSQVSPRLEAELTDVPTPEGQRIQYLLDRVPDEEQDDVMGLV